LAALATVAIYEHASGAATSVLLLLALFALIAAIILTTDRAYDGSRFLLTSVELTVVVQVIQASICTRNPR
jgi:hypothetical protein